MAQVESMGRSTHGAKDVAIGELLTRGVAVLRPAVDSPRLEAELLLALTSGFSRSSIMAFPERRVRASCAVAFDAAVHRRANGEPLAHITESREFYSLPLKVSAAVLVPRQETEVLVEAALEHAKAEQQVQQVLDLGTGSGAIALAIKHERPDLEVTAVERARNALGVARENGGRLHIDVEWLESDWFEALAGRCFGLIVSNPPYVRSEDPHFAGPLEFEPRQALDGGPGGLEAYAEILIAAPAHLAPDGLLLLEHGFDQREALSSLAREHGYRVVFTREDWNGHPRVLALTHEPTEHQS